MDKIANVRRITISSATFSKASPRSKASTPVVEARSLQRRRAKGQALVLVTLAMMLLIAIVGLAIDGGSMLGQRREAQNGTDGAALAGTRVMLTQYRQMIQANPNGDVNYGHSYELQIRSAIEQYAALNGVMTSTLKAYFVNDDRQIVTMNIGIDRGQGHCGIGQARGPCEVGENGQVPWVQGAKGIDVRGTAETDTFFMSAFGWDKVSGSAGATAFMGVGAMADNISLMPIGLFTNTIDYANLQEGRRYTLIDSDLDTGSGNWGWVDYNGQGSPANVVRAWVVCGFNPSTTQGASWAAWCPQYTSAPGYGPTRHYVPIDEAEWRPNPIPTYINSIVYGEAHRGWWVRGSSGVTTSVCNTFKSRVDSSGPNGIVVLFPIFDTWIPDGGQASFYHVRIIVAFRIRPGDVSCLSNQLPTPTPCPPTNPCPTATPSSGGGGGSTWFIQGEAVKIHSTTSSGRHGNIRHTSVPVIFLDR